MITLQTQKITPQNFRQNNNNNTRTHQVNFRETLVSPTNMTGLKQNVAKNTFLSKIFGSFSKEMTKDGIVVTKFDKNGNIKYIDLISNDKKKRERTFFDKSGEKIRSAIYEGKNFIRKLTEATTYKNGEAQETRRFGNGHVFNIENPYIKTSTQEDESLEQYLNYTLF